MRNLVVGGVCGGLTVFVAGWLLLMWTFRGMWR